MKIIEGTPQEIAEYIDGKSRSDNPFTPKKVTSPLSLSEAIKKELTRSYTVSTLKRDRLMRESHWSNSKHEWVPIKDMNEVYITNVLRKRLNDNRGIDLLEDDEFKSLIVNLSEKILEAK
jgi:hypothetical protein